MKCTQSKPSLLNDLFYSFIGLDSNMIRVRKRMLLVDVFLKSSISKDDMQIINTLLSIIIGVKECKYRIDDAYYTAGVIKQCLFRGIEEELAVFMNRVNEVRKSSASITVKSLPFLFQKEINMFSRISAMLKEIDCVSDLFLLEVVMKSKVEWISITKSIMLPINHVLVQLIEGKDTNGYFEERNTYDYNKCFWSSHYRIKEVPLYLQSSIKTLTNLGKLSKIRRAMCEAEIRYIGDIICLQNHTVIVNGQSIDAYYKQLCDCPVVRKEWKNGVTDVFGRIGLDVVKYSELFKELGNKMFQEPTKKHISMANYLMKRGSTGYSSFEEHVDSPCFSFLDDSTFLLDNVEGVRISPISFVYNEISFPNTLLGIHDTKSSKRAYGLSLLQGLDISLSLREPVQMFFSAKSISELKILFRLVYSLYAVEYFICSQYSHWRIRQVLLGFVTGVRMFITEKIEEEFQKIMNEKIVTMYHTTLEDAMSNITKASLLTNPSLIQFYSKVFLIAFMYIELSNREMLTQEEVEEIIQSLRNCFKTAMPYIKSPFLIMLFESLV